MKDLWSHYNGLKYITSFTDTAWRLIEAQHIFSTRKLVDSIAEQEILEEIIETVKPPLFNKSLIDLHPLLYTPFRYPPLPYGSRFGKNNEPSLWYGSIELNTAMAEKAFYQFNFLRASKASFGMIETTLTAFSTDIKTSNGIFLIDDPFVKHLEDISSPTDYQASQLLGTAMRHANIEAFNYHSARSRKNGINVALFSPKAFRHKKPNAASFQTWHCSCNSHRIEFSRTSALDIETIIFSIEEFLIHDVLPFPAC